VGLANCETPGAALQAAIPGVLAMTAVEELLALMARLRDPEHGCPWDREQDFSTIAPYTLEEAYEVADAIAREEPQALRDELGDLLFQVVFHAQMAHERGWFDFQAVAAGIVEKMIRRHPHVFGEHTVADAGAQTEAWEAIKARERGEAATLDGIPLALPALTRAAKLQRRAARVGFDWPTLAPVLGKLREELDELDAAMNAREAQARLAEELGDLLFSAVNLARHLEIDPEAALRAANAKFERRFRGVEARLAASGRRPADADLAELDALWEQVKRSDGKES